jgi:hypothetical protein
MSNIESFEQMLSEIKELAKDVTPTTLSTPGRKQGFGHVHIGLMRSCNKAKEIDLLSGGLASSALRKQSDRLHFLCPGQLEIDGQIVKCGCWCHRNLRWLVIYEEMVAFIQGHDDQERQKIVIHGRLVEEELMLLDLTMPGDIDRCKIVRIYAAAAKEIWV